MPEPWQTTTFEARELVDAREALSWRDRRRALRAARWGRAVSDEAVARFAVAAARQALRDLKDGPGWIRLCLVALLAPMSAISLVLKSGWTPVAVMLLVIGAAGSADALTQIGLRGRLRRSEQLNRRFLVDMGRPFADDLSAAVRRRSYRKWFASIIGRWILADLLFGVLLRLQRGESLTSDHILTSGLLLGTFFTIVSLMRSP